MEIVPATVLLFTFLAAADTGTGLRDVRLRIPVAVDSPRQVQVVAQDGTLRLASRGTGEEWLTHCTATAADGVALADLPGRPAAPADWAELEESLRRRGVGGYGFDWKIRDLRREGDYLACEVTVGPAASWAPLLDGALTVVSALVDGDDLLRMPSRIASVTVQGMPPESAAVFARARDGLIDVTLRPADREPGGVDVTGLAFAPLDGAPGALTAPRLLVHELTWRPHGAGNAPQSLPGPVVVTPADDRFLEPLRQAGVTCLPAGTPELAAELAARAGAALVVTIPPPTGRDADVAAENNAWSLIRTAQVLARMQAPPRLACLATAGDIGHAPLRGVARTRPASSPPSGAASSRSPPDSSAPPLSGPGCGRCSPRYAREARRTWSR